MHFDSAEQFVVSLTGHEIPASYTAPVSLCLQGYQWLKTITYWTAATPHKKNIITCEPLFKALTALKNAGHNIGDYEYGNKETGTQSARFEHIDSAESGEITAWLCDGHYYYVADVIIYEQQQVVADGEDDLWYLWFEIHPLWLSLSLSGLIPWQNVVVSLAGSHLESSHQDWLGISQGGHWLTEFITTWSNSVCGKFVP